MCRKVLLLTLLVTLGACRETKTEYILGPERIVEVQRHDAADKPAMFRYDRSITIRDTLYVYHATPDKGFVFCYVYLNSRLSHINVYDYFGETSENFLDFLPKFYLIAIPDHGGK